MQRQIKVTIDALGNPKVEAIGFNGVGCEAATKSIEDALAGSGGMVVREHKPEFYNDADANTQQEQHLSW